MTTIKQGDLVKVSVDNNRVWLKVINITEDDITGLIDNEPVDSNLKYGDILHVREEQILHHWRMLNGKN